MLSLKRPTRPTSTAPLRYDAHYEEASYLNRTRRNHFWIGGVANQMKLRDLRVGVAGLGGMGSHIAEQLVRLGVGTLKIADMDIVEETNLNRQAIANRLTIGRPKIEASIHELRNIARDFRLEGFPEGITEANADAFVAGLDVVVNEIDVAPLAAHVVLHRAARRKGIPVYTALSLGMGIHFYKFQGEDYTFEDFLGAPPGEYETPSAAFLIDRFGEPMPDYLSPRATEGFERAIRSGGTPILGPSVLLGHSMVVMRILIDRFGESLRSEWGLGRAIAATPVMPEMLVLDLADLSLRIEKIRGRSVKQAA